MSSAVFLRSSRQRVPIIYNRNPSPSKLPLRLGGSGPRLTHASLGRLESKRHVDRFSRVCRAHNCDRETDRQTDRPLSIGRIRDGTGSRVTGSQGHPGRRVTGSAILTGSGRVTGQCVRSVFDQVLSFNMLFYRVIVSTE